MATLTIYYGGKKPMKSTGKHQCALLSFAEKFHGWHTYNHRCRDTVRAVKALQKKGYLEVNESFEQFRLTYPKD